MASLYVGIVLCIIAGVSCSVRQLDTEKAQLAQYIANKRPTLNQRYRPLYHVAPPVGWMNDPNGFSYFKGEYHIFYQFYPYNATTTGPIHWGHSSSKNLVDWTELPTALIPEEEQCFSGSGIAVGNELVLIYTAHVVTSASTYNETQYLASSIDGLDFVKYARNPVILSSPNGLPDFRDPKVWKHENNYYVVLGSKTDDNNGRVLLYKSPDLHTWENVSIIGESNGTMGYMWECPDFFELGGKYILLMSPQGLQPQGDRYKNTFQTGYIIGSFNYSTHVFEPEVEFQEIDFGHDFYATQTIDQGGKRIMVAWFGMWDVPHPEAEDGWAGMLTIMRELTLVGDRIIQKPVEAMTQLRESTFDIKQLASNQSIELGKAAEIIISANLSQSIAIKLEGINGNNTVWLGWEPDVGKVVVDRGSDDIRQVEWSPLGATKSWRLFLDASSLELFCGEGEVVFSSRVFPDGNWKVTNLSPQTLDINAYNLRKSIYVNTVSPSSSSTLNPLFSLTLFVFIHLLKVFH